MISSTASLLYALVLWECLDLVNESMRCVKRRGYRGLRTMRVNRYYSPITTPRIGKCLSVCLLGWDILSIFFVYLVCFFEIGLTELGYNNEVVRQKRD